MDAVRLPSGRAVTIRPIAPSDAAALKLAYERLSPQSKYRRFLAPKPHLTSSDTRYLVHVDGRDHVALVATPADDPAWILGVARFVRVPDDPELAELAIVVGDRFQQEGLATALVARLARRATELGITRFRGTMLSENQPADRLVKAAAARVVRERLLGPVKEIEIELPAPAPVR
jgi:RimJ/RimL family protein N-acetyltransferase